MTVLFAEKIFEQPREALWRLISQFASAPQWIEGIEKVEPVSGPATDTGGVWRAHVRWGHSYQVIDFEITDWLEGESFSLRPLHGNIEGEDTALYEIALNLKTLSDHQTQVTAQCGYSPRGQLAKIKNLAFLRRQYLQRLQASLEVLGRVASEQAPSANE